MKNITKNEMRVLLILFKDFINDYNANNLSKKIGITSMGALKILKSLEAQGLLKSKKLGKAVFYKLDLDKNYVKLYMEFLLKKEAEEAIPRIKRWINELRVFDEFGIGILFGSVLNKEKFSDVDFLLVSEKLKSKKLNELVEDVNKVNIKEIHFIKQTKNDFKGNLLDKDKVIVSAVKRGIVVSGYKEFVEVIRNVP